MIRAQQRETGHPLLEFHRAMPKVEKWNGCQSSHRFRVKEEGGQFASETDTQNLNKRSYNNNTQNQSIHLRGHLSEHKTDGHITHVYTPSCPLAPLLSPESCRAAGDPHTTCVPSNPTLEHRAWHDDWASIHTHSSCLSLFAYASYGFIGLSSPNVFHSLKISFSSSERALWHALLCILMI